MPAGDFPQDPHGSGCRDSRRTPLRPRPGAKPSWIATHMSLNYLCNSEKHTATRIASAPAARIAPCYPCRHELCSQQAHNRPTPRQRAMHMGDIVDLIVGLNKPVPGKNMFIACPCSHYTLWTVVVVNDARGCFITTLVCGNCENEVQISFGRPV